jgi:hypothetical protein
MTTENREPGNDGYIVTFTGKKFWPLKPRIEDIDIIDIAHALSCQCRFTGHTRFFYSVAQHSLAVSRLCTMHPLSGLLHDASEAYLIDLCTPMKVHPLFAPYREAEKHLQGMIYMKFGLSLDHPRDVNISDKTMGILEGISLMPENDDVFWTQNSKIFGDNPPLITADPPWRAEELFIDRFRELYHG